MTWNLLESLDLLRTWRGPRGEPATVHRVLPLRYNSQYLFIRKPTSRHKLEFISESLSTQLLEHICVTLSDAWGYDKSRRRDQVGDNDFDMARVYSMIQEIVALQAQLEATEDNDEQRALEEDLTGRILWFYWCGILSEVDHMLAMVVNHIRQNRYMLDEYDYRDLYRTAEIIKKTSHVGPADDIAHLRRIMFDAGAGISKHKLWLAVWPAGQNGDVMEPVSQAPIPMISLPTTSSENDTICIERLPSMTRPIDVPGVHHKQCFPMLDQCTIPFELQTDI